MKSLLLPLGLALGLGACASSSELTSYFSPYKIDIRQGNFVTQEMVSQLKPGLSRDQVRFILGSPLVVDVFHSDRWDYIYRFKPGIGEVAERRLTVFFQDNQLVRVAGDVVAGAGAATPQPVTRVIDIPPAQEEKKE